MENAFKFLKDEGTYYRIRPVMEGRSNNENAKKHAQLIKQWFNLNSTVNFTEESHSGPR